MDRYEQFRRAAVGQGIPSDEVDKFVDQLRFAIWAGGGARDEGAIGQVGGLPRLPVGVEWPSGGSGTPLPFIASVDCALLPRAEGLPLPEDGSLLFFLHHEEDVEDLPDTDGPGFARVLYVPVGTDTAVASLPPGHDSTTLFHEDMPFLLPESWLSAWVEPVLPEWIEESDVEFESDIVKQLVDDLKHIDELCELVDDLWTAPDHDFFLRIGGYCEEMGGQNPPWTQMARDNLKNLHGAELDVPESERSRLRHEEERRLVRDWVPLAQFYTQSDLYYGCFLIRFEDLAAKRFDGMRSFTMFTE
ncbi:MAG TPA: DUF1963 domain-containing protein [Umezawaea sp.]|nr:DUF1963 domain-containing protein [Umezawaea sp.]